MTNDQQIALDWIVAEEAQGGWNKHAMPFKLARFKGVRDTLVHQGLVMRTDTGRYVPAPGQAVCPGKPTGQSARTLEGSHA